MRIRSCLKYSAGLLALVVTGPAWAADLLPPPPPPPPAVEIGGSSGSSCLYLRADVGGVFHERPTVTKAAIGGGGGIGGSTEAVGESIEDTAFFEGGLGCQFTDNFRMEVVGGLRLKQSLTDPFNSLDADIQTYTGFVNFTYDITNYGGWTPYIGGGVGIAHHEISNVVAPVDSGSGSEIDFAWNLHAGVSYDLASNVKVDFGYRYTDLGKAVSGGPIPMFVDDLTAHEFKVGLRYHFGTW
jgi:opacity protein-like surface antigen